jgi:hypothetical protein
MLSAHNQAWSVNRDGASPSDRHGMLEGEQITTRDMVPMPNWPSNLFNVFPAEFENDTE